MKLYLKEAKAIFSRSAQDDLVTVRGLCDALDVLVNGVSPSCKRVSVIRPGEKITVPDQNNEKSTYENDVADAIGALSKAFMATEE